MTAGDTPFTSDELERAASSFVDAFMEKYDEKQESLLQHYEDKIDALASDGGVVAQDTRVDPETAQRAAAAEETGVDGAEAAYDAARDETRRSPQKTDMTEKEALLREIGRVKDEEYRPEQVEHMFDLFSRYSVDAADTGQDATPSYDWHDVDAVMAEVGNSNYRLREPEHAALAGTAPTEMDIPDIRGHLLDIYNDTTQVKQRATALHNARTMTENLYEQLDG